MDNASRMRRIAGWVIHGIAVVILVQSASLVVGTVLGALVVMRMPALVGHPNIVRGLETLGPSLLAFSMDYILAARIVICALMIWRRVRYLILVPSLVLCWGALGYFGYDLQQRPSLPDVGPVASSDAESFKLFCWMTGDSPLSRIKELSEQNIADDAFITQPPDLWRTWLMSNRDRVLGDWTKDAVGREWIDSMARTPCSGVVLLGMDGPLFRFQPFRAVVNHQLAYAALLAVNGRGDDAARSLTNLLRASHALQRSGAGTLMSMIASACLSRSYEVSQFVTDCGAISPDAKRELAAALSDAPPIEKTIWNCFVGEFAPNRESLGRGAADGESRIASNSTTALGRRIAAFRFGQMCNLNLTEQELLDFLQQSAKYAQRRQFQEMRDFKDQIQNRQKAWYRIKNPVGRTLLAMIEDLDLAKVAEKLWKVEDARLALIKRLDEVATPAAINGKTVVIEGRWNGLAKEEGQIVCIAEPKIVDVYNIGQRARPLEGQTVRVTATLHWRGTARHERERAEEQAEQAPPDGYIVDWSEAKWEKIEPKAPVSN
jgi:hypothetical protein